MEGSFTQGKKTGIQIIECPRDAMQGWPHFIPTEKKLAYLIELLQVGFHTLDCGSFVSAKAIPQMMDTAEVLQGLNLENTKTKLLVIVANERGALEAAMFEHISYLGFPFSISETFQQRNTNSSIEESLKRLDAIQNLCIQSNKKLVVYLSMGFGNPYGDPYSEEVLLYWAAEMVKRNIAIVSLADTVGVATPEQIKKALNALIPAYSQTEFGVHLHSTPQNWQLKLEAALEAGCRRIDVALKGIGGCPMAGNDLVGNMNTENVVSYLHKNQFSAGINFQALERGLALASEIFI